MTKEVVSHKGGNIAGEARKKLEIESGNKVIKKENYLKKPQDKKLLSDNNKE